MSEEDAMFRVAVVDHRFGALDIERSILEPLGAELTDLAGADPELVPEACGDVDGILLGARYRFGPQQIGALRRCRVIARYGVGVNNVDVAAARTAGIQVSYVPDYCVEEVSDHALAMLLAMNRRLGALDAHVRSGSWSTAPGAGIRRLGECVLGVVGYGRIGSRLGAKARCLGMRVLAFDPGRSGAEVEALGATPVDLETLLRSADYVSLHAPAPSTREHLLDRARIALMKDGACLINVARGDLVDEAALVEALEAGRLGGAALDVTDPEPPAPGSPLLEAPNLILTPHAAWLSTSAVVELRTRAAEDVALVLRGGSPRYVASA
jgi:D-3-phosphoglycerate dehydrogenase / 2-oxoglutarate reductase